MSNKSVQEKLIILANAAKYDVSCSSSGSKRKNINKGLGNTDGIGICHSYTEDGRCVSLLKILLTNFCIYDCAYCISRSSNDVKRAAFTVSEVVDLTINFYRRNYIEGLFLSSGIFKNADYTMERLVRVAKELRIKHNFNGYIHLKTIPGASDELIKAAGLYADRLSVNIELPTEKSLQELAPEKNFKEIFTPMSYIKNEIKENREDKLKLSSTPHFARAGQSTQLIVGASPENDLQILSLASDLYSQKDLKRVYYSAYVPVSTDKRLPFIEQTPVIRENRLYQADWLLRFYGFALHEIVDPSHPELDLQIDPKLAYALRNPHIFPLEINSADLELIIRVPGIGVKSAHMIVKARRFSNLNFDYLQKIGVALKRAKYFITCKGQSLEKKIFDSKVLKQLILQDDFKKNIKNKSSQLSLF